MKKFAVALAVAVAFTVTGAYAKDAKDAGTTSTASTKAEGKAVGNKHCPVMPEETVGEKSKSVTYKGETVKVCCKKCVKKFNENPEEYLKKAKEDAAK